MGGSAFSAGAKPLFTPRMAKQVYTAVKARYQQSLSGLYHYVASPIDGPAKSDFGDVDIVVASPKYHTSDIKQAFATIKEALGAHEAIYEGGKSMTTNFAVPWPADQPSAEDSPESGQRSSATETSPKSYIQVDVKICTSLEQLQWMLFKHGHGDIWNLIGSVIRPYGLTVDDDAMWLRIPEIENNNRKRAKVFLTADPVEVLRFLGLPIGGFWDGPFDDMNIMFEYVAQCRMFYVKPERDLDPESVNQSLKSNDRRRMKTRPGFRKWTEEFIPQCAADQRFLQMKTTREEVMKQAIEWFHVEDDYHQRRRDCLLEQNKDSIWTNVIKTAIPMPDPSDLKAIQQRSVLLKALKKVIIEGDESYGITLAHEARNEQGFLVAEKVEEFILQYCEDVARAANAQHQDAYQEHLMKKAAAVPTV